MKLTFKKFLWVLGIFAVIGFIGNASSPSASVQGIQTTIIPTIESTTVPTIEPTATNTPVPTITSTPTPKYVAPTATPTSIPTTTTSSGGLNNDNYYTNVDGNEVHSPAYSDTVPAGASAICGDGTYSFSQSRRGTCSHHGGVAQWL